jgi:hypothetical protein
MRSAMSPVRAMAFRMMGSPDVYQREEREAEQSVNFVTCHDGFTLNDLVSFNGKHNEVNGENNRDGEDSNLSWNCGIEGPTADPEIAWQKALLLPPWVRRTSSPISNIGVPVATSVSVRKFLTWRLRSRSKPITSWQRTNPATPTIPAAATH